MERQVFCFDHGDESCRVAVQIHGDNGCCKDYPVEPFYRDAKNNEIIEGASQMHEVLIATSAFRNL